MCYVLDMDNPVHAVFSMALGVSLLLAALFCQGCAVQAGPDASPVPVFEGPEATPAHDPASALGVIQDPPTDTICTVPNINLCIGGWNVTCVDSVATTHLDSPCEDVIYNGGES